jgi:hypothetical protein
MARLRPGWLIAVCAAVLAVSVWLPWLTTAVNGGGHANAVGGTAGSLKLTPGFGAGQLIVLLTSALLVAGAMAARGLSTVAASIAALMLSLLIAALTGWYRHLYVSHDVVAGYGLYLGAGGAAGAIGFSAWALVDAVLARRAVR